MNYIDYSLYQLLWFRPLSDLNYTLPQALSHLNWHKTIHLPIDNLKTYPFNLYLNGLNTQLNSPLKNILVLSSPTAAHIAAQWNWQTITTIAVMGQASKIAWQQAKGIEPINWIVSPTGESMGLFTYLKAYPHIIIVRGNQGRNDLINHLKALSITITILVAYDKQNLTHSQSFTDTLRHAFSMPTLIALYFTSTDQVLRILNCISNIQTVYNLPDIAIKHSLVLTSHHRIKAKALELGFIQVLCTESTGFKNGF